MKNPDVVDYYMYPRFYAVAEVAWTPAEAKNYTDFLARIRKQYARLDLQQVKACRNYFDAYIDGAFNKRTRKFEVRITGMIPDSEIRYTTDGRIPTLHQTYTLHRLYSIKIRLLRQQYLLLTAI